jgi:hypothetical protein
MSILKDGSLMKLMDTKMKDDLEEIKNNLIYTRKVNTPYIDIMQSLYRIRGQIEGSIKYRGGYLK